eukprot:2706999-Rhodomonas_salina.1
MPSFFGKPLRCERCSDIVKKALAEFQRRQMQLMAEAEEEEAEDGASDDDETRGKDRKKTGDQDWARWIAWMFVAGLFNVGVSSVKAYARRSPPRQKKPIRQDAKVPTALDSEGRAYFALACPLTKEMSPN